MKIEDGRKAIESWGDGSGIKIFISEFGFDEHSDYGELALDFDYKVHKPYPNLINNGIGDHGALTFTTHRSLLPEADLYLMPPSGSILYEKAMEIKPHVICASLKAINGLSPKQERDLLDQGIYLVVSSGNSGADGETQFAINHYMWTSVGAVRVDRNGDILLQPYSSYGKGAVDFVGYAGMQIPMKPKPVIFHGTSQSAPYFADQVALVSRNFELQHDRRPTKSEVDNYLRLISADLYDPDKDLKTGWGLPILPQHVPDLREGDLIEFKIGEKPFYINNVKGNFDAVPYLNNEVGRTMVELNGIAMALGLSIGYNPDTQTVWIRR